MHRVTLTLALAVLPAARLTAQHQMPASDTDSGPPVHGRAFSSGTREGWTFSTPHLDIDGGVYGHTVVIPVSGGGTGGPWDGCLRLHVQTALGIHLVQVSSDLLWIPSFGATPVWSGTLELAPIRQESPFYLAGGFGLITGHDVGADRLVGWVNGTAALRTPIHELTPFVQVGQALTHGNEVEVLIGIAHPLAPYKLHFP